MPSQAKAKISNSTWFRAAYLGALVCSLGLTNAVAQGGNVQAPVPAQSGVTGSQAFEDTYKLDTGDKLRVIVFGEPDLGGEYEVDGSGFVRLPLIGQIPAAGIGLHDFEIRVKSALEEGYLKNAKVSIEVINYRPFYILGQVNKPGEYPFVNGMSVLNAVALAAVEHGTDVGVDQRGRRTQPGSDAGVREPGLRVLEERNDTG